MRRGFLPALPGTAATPVDLVTEDDAARAIARLLFDPSGSGTYHVAGGDRAPTLGDVVGRFGVRFLEEEQFAWAVSKWRHENPRLASAYDELASFIYELAYPKIFDTSRSGSSARGCGDDRGLARVAARGRCCRGRAGRRGTEIVSDVLVRARPFRPRVRVAQSKHSAVAGTVPAWRGVSHEKAFALSPALGLLLLLVANGKTARSRPSSSA